MSIVVVPCAFDTSLSNELRIAHLERAVSVLLLVAEKTAHAADSEVSEAGSRDEQPS